VSQRSGNVGATIVRSYVPVSNMTQSQQSPAQSTPATRVDIVIYTDYLVKILYKVI